MALSFFLGQTDSSAVFLSKRTEHKVVRFWVHAGRWFSEGLGSLAIASRVVRAAAWVTAAMLGASVALWCSSAMTSSIASAREGAGHAETFSFVAAQEGGVRVIFD